MSSISAGTTTNTALTATADTSGDLALKTNGDTTALTLNAAQALGVGSTPDYGAAGEVLTSAGDAAPPSWGLIDLSTSVAGALAVSNGGTGKTSLTANRVILGNGTSAVQEVAPGTSGNILTSNGTTWVSSAPAASGAMVLLSTTSASGASFDVTTGFSSTYDNYVLYGVNIVLASAGNLSCLGRFGGSYLTSAYNYVRYNGGGVAAGSGASSWPMVAGSGGSQYNFKIDLTGVNSSSGTKLFSWVVADIGISSMAGQGINTSTAVLSGLRFTTSSSGFSTGTVYLYGIKKA